MLKKKGEKAHHCPTTWLNGSLIEIKITVVGEAGVVLGYIECYLLRRPRLTEYTNGRFHALLSFTSQFYFLFPVFSSLLLASPSPIISSSSSSSSSSTIYLRLLLPFIFVFFFFYLS